MVFGIQTAHHPNGAIANLAGPRVEAPCPGASPALRFDPALGHAVRRDRSLSSGAVHLHETIQMT